MIAFPHLPPSRAPHPLAALFLVGCLIGPGFAADAPATNAVPSTDFAAFRILTERNIFNAKRSGRTRSNRREGARTPPVEVLSLVGTLTHEHGRFAFFDGSRSDYRRVVEPDGLVAGFKVADITDHSVRLLVGTNCTELRVGMQLRRPENESWKVLALGEGTDYVASPASSTSDGSSTSSGTGETRAEGAVSDVLKRLMQQREKELQ